MIEARVTHIAGRKVGTVAEVALALVLATLTSLAWACTPQGVISVTNPVGQAGSIQQVYGTGFAPKSVEVRWNSAEGPLLGIAEGPEFTMNLGIPESEEGFYYLVAVQAGTEGHAAPVRTAATFKVTGPGRSSVGSEVQSDMWSGFDASKSSAESLATQENASQQLSRRPAMFGFGALLAAISAFLLLIAASNVKDRRTSSSSSAG